MNEIPFSFQNRAMQPDLTKAKEIRLCIANITFIFYGTFGETSKTSSKNGAHILDIVKKPYSATTQPKTTAFSCADGAFCTVREFKG